MSALFSAFFPAWITQPSIIQNVFDHPFASLSDIPTAVNLSEFPHFMSGLKQALFWRKRLSSSVSNNTVIFSFLGVRGLILPNVLEVCKALKNICNMSSLVEVYRAPNSPFIGISFSHPDESLKFQALHSFDNHLLVHVSASSSLVHHFKLQGLPPLFHDSRIHHFLSKHSTHHHFTRDLIATDVDILTPSNSVTGTLQLSPDQDVSTLPHLIPLPAPHLGSALLIISGRQSLCLKCGGFGHTRCFCSTLRCSLCHRFHPSSATCSTTSLLPDASLGLVWSAFDTSNSTSPSLHQPLSSVSLTTPECVRTRHTSSPAMLSSPVSSTSPSALTSSVPITSVTPVMSVSLDHHFIPNLHPTKSFSRNNNSSAVSHPVAVFPSNKLTSYANIISSGSSTLRSPVIPAPSLTTTVIPSKRVHSALSPPLVSPLLSPSANIYKHLVDEVDSSTIISPIVSSQHLPLVSEHSSPLASSHKRSKLQGSSPPSPLMNTSAAVCSSPVASHTLWGDRMESEDISSISIPAASHTAIYTHASTVSHHSSSISSLPASDHPPSKAISNSLSPFNAHSYSDSDDEPRDDDISVFILGFPVDTSINSLKIFAGDPPPFRIHMNGDDIFTGHFFYYRHDTDISSLLLKDGLWYGKFLITVTQQFNDLDSEDSG